MNFHRPDDISGILEMIFRRGPQMMKTSGGSLESSSKQNIENLRPRITEETKRRILELASTGIHTGTEIARMTDRSQSTVHKLIQTAGISVPDGRAKAD
jgi:transposase-like protein